MKMISEGAEAVIYDRNELIIKQRKKKDYRLKEIDDRIIKSRNKKEIKILNKLAGIVNVPKVISGEENKILMEKIVGKRLSESLDKLDKTKQNRIAKNIGKIINQIHEMGIVHNDLTTSNLILSKKGLFIIDFGMSIENGKIEDKAVDIHLFKQSLEAKHFNNWVNLFEEFKKEYEKGNEGKKVLDRLKIIEKRGRYRF